MKRSRRGNPFAYRKKLPRFVRESRFTEVAMTKTADPLVGFRPASTNKECVADILERELDATIKEWMGRVETEPELIRIPLNFEERTGHLPKLLHDVIARLRLDKGTRA